MATRNIQMNYFNGSTYDILHPEVDLTNITGQLDITNTTGNLSAERVSYSNSTTSSIISSNQVQGAIDDLFTSVSNGKNLIASAVTDKGVSTSGSSSWSVIAENIGKISSFSGTGATLVKLPAEMIDGGDYSDKIIFSIPRSLFSSSGLYYFMIIIIGSAYIGGKIYNRSMEVGRYRVAQDFENVQQPDYGVTTTSTAWEFNTNTIFLTKFQSDFVYLLYYLNT